MARDYNIIHFIQNRMADIDDQITSIIVRMFTRIDERCSYAAALSTSITLFIAMKHLGLSPKLILGTIQFQGISYPHAWLELDEKVYDLATYEDVIRHPVLKDRELQDVMPQVNIGYEEASDAVRYYPFQFGGTWELHGMKMLVGKTFEQYADKSPHDDIFADACYILGISETKENVDKLRAIAKLETIKDRDETVETEKIDNVENQKKDVEKPANLKEKLKILGESLKRSSSKPREKGR